LSYGRTLDTLWTKTYPHLNQNIVKFAIETSDKGILVASESYDSINMPNALTGLVKLDQYMNQQWSYNIFATSKSDFPCAIYEKANGCFLIFTIRCQYPQMVVTTLTPSGTVATPAKIYQKYFRTVKKHSTNLFALIVSNPNNSTTHKIIEMNENADSIGQINFNSEDSLYERDIVPLDDGIIFCGQKFRLSDYTSQLHLYRLNNAGQIIWHQSYGTFSYNFADISLSLIDNNLFVIGERSTSINVGPETYSSMLLKFDLNGALIWDNFSNVCGKGTIEATNIMQLSTDKTFVLSGFDFVGQSQIQHFIIPYDSTGIIQNINTFNFTEYNLPNLITLQLSDTRIIGITGRSNSFLNQAEQVCAMELKWNFPPFFTSANFRGVFDVMEDSLFTDTVIALDSFPNDQIHYGLANTIPLGMSIDSNKGILLWTPLTEKDSGNHAISVTATDRTGQSDTLHFTLHIISQNDAPVIDSINSSVYGDTVFLKSYVHDEENDTINYLWIKNGTDTIGTKSTVSFTRSELSSDVITLFARDATHTTSKQISLSTPTSSVRSLSLYHQKTDLVLSRTFLRIAFADNLNVNSDISISIMDLNGRLVKSVNIHPNSLQNYWVSFNSSPLNAGLYIRF
jgi:hypothetical protein